MNTGLPGIAQLIETMNMGGAENLALQLAGHHAAAGHESHLIVLTGPGPLSPRIPAGVRTHYLNYERASIEKPWLWLPSVIRGTRLLRGLLRSQGIQLVQTHLPAANYWGLIMSRLGVCRAVATVHNNQEFQYTAADRGLKVRLRKAAYRRIVGECARTVAVSDAVRNSLIAELDLGEAAADKVVVVTNGVPVPDLPAPEQVAATRACLGLEPAEKLLVGAGRLDEQKNFGDLVAAAAIWRRRGLAYRVVIVGEGPGRAGLEAAVAEASLDGSVSLLGLRDDLGTIFEAADLLVFPSLWEGLPLVVLEAMAAGLPVVGNRIPGLRELVTDGVNGRLVDPGDVEALAEAVGEALSDLEALARWSAAARDMVRERYDFQRTGDRTIDVYVEALR